MLLNVHYPFISQESWQEVTTDRYEDYVSLVSSVIRWKSPTGQKIYILQVIHIYPNSICKMLAVCMVYAQLPALQMTSHRYVDQDVKNTAEEGTTNKAKYYYKVLFTWTQNTKKKKENKNKKLKDFLQSVKLLVLSLPVLDSSGSSSSSDISSKSKLSIVSSSCCLSSIRDDMSTVL